MSNARLKELEDREAIRQVFVDYARCLDGGDYAGYAALFARNGTFGEAAGRDAVAEQMEAYGARVEAGRAEGRFTDAIHIMGNHEIDVRGDVATARVSWIYAAVDPDHMPQIFQIGHYDDVLVREDGAWKIARHQIRRVMGRGQLEEATPSRIDEVQRRLRELEDREAIRQIFTDYARFLDSGDHHGYARLFAREGVLVASLGDAVGPEAIVQLLGKYREAAQGRALPRAVHVVSNHDIAITGDRATAKVFWFYLTTNADAAPVILQGGHYTDELVREDGAWKLARHDITRIMGHAPYADAPLTRLDALEERVRRLEGRG